MSVLCGYMDTVYVQGLVIVGSWGTVVLAVAGRVQAARRFLGSCVEPCIHLFFKGGAMGKRTHPQTHEHKEALTLIRSHARTHVHLHTYMHFFFHNHTHAVCVRV